MPERSLSNPLRQLSAKIALTVEENRRGKTDIKTKIIVAAHKPYWMPKDGLYQPIQLGAIGQPSIHPGWLRDDTGDNISDRNHTYCELTGLYWAWKHLNADVVGLCHYRRYLGDRRFWKPGRERLLGEPEIRRFLGQCDVILPRKRHYWIETRESQYAHAHHIEDLRCAEEVLAEKYPACLPAFHHMLHSRSGHICNMFVARKALFDEYCAWLFDILFEVESRLDISGYSSNDSRVFGFLGERLLDVWVEAKGLRIVEAPFVNLENQHWLRKGMSFLRRKFGRKYDHEKN